MISCEIQMQHLVLHIEHRNKSSQALSFASFQLHHRPNPIQLIRKKWVFLCRCACLGVCIRNPEGCPNNSYDIPRSSHGSFGQLYHMKASQLHNCLTCPITFLAALLPCSLDKLSPGARSQEGIAKICYFSKSLFLGETGSMRNVIAGLEEFFVSAEICYNIFSFFPLYLLLWNTQVYKHILVRQWPFRH